MFLDSESTLHSSNKWYDFTAEIPKQITLKDIDNYQIALCDISESECTNKKKDEENTLTSLIKPWYVYCDVVQPSLIGEENYYPLLNIVTKTGPISKRCYMDISRDYINRIRIYIRDKKGSLPTDTISCLRCTLHLRKRLDSI